MNHVDSYFFSFHFPCKKVQKRSRTQFTYPGWNREGEYIITEMIIFLFNPRFAKM